MSPPPLASPLALPREEVHVWFVEPDAVTDEALLARFCGWLAPEEVKRRDRYMFDRSKREYLLTRALARSTLSRYAAVAPEAWSFTANAWGRPEIASREHAHLRFNLSNTFGLIACAVAWAREVGVDVEDPSRHGATVAIADRFFSPLEVEALRRLPEEAQRDRFFDYWTLKEAYIKARGMGLAIPLDQFSFLLEEAAPIRLVGAPELGDDGASWQFEKLELTRRHRTALAIRRGDDRPLRVVVREAALGDGRW